MGTRKIGSARRIDGIRECFRIEILWLPTRPTFPGSWSGGNDVRIRFRHERVRRNKYGLIDKNRTVGVGVARQDTVDANSSLHSRVDADGAIVGQRIGIPRFDADGIADAEHEDLTRSVDQIDVIRQRNRFSLFRVRFDDFQLPRELRVRFDRQFVEIRPALFHADDPRLPIKTNVRDDDVSIREVFAS
jgi:hypothetical protein